MVGLRPPPPSQWGKRVRRERVVASQLRPDDWLVTGDGPLRILAVEHSARSSRLLSNGVWWSCKPSTRFVRLRQSRRIDMRPDLRSKSNEEDAK